jgi:hypothetical protein
MAMHAWEVHIKRTNKVFDGLTDEQLFQEIAPGRNRVIYLLGHLLAVHDGMLPILGLGNRLYPQLDEAFIKNPDRTIADLPAAAQLREWWSNINNQLAEHFQRLQPGEWFYKHTLISDEDFQKEPHRNRLSVLINRTNHLSYHLGQLVLVKNNE